MTQKNMIGVLPKATGRATGLTVSAALICLAAMGCAADINDDGYASSSHDGTGALGGSAEVSDGQSSSESEAQGESPAFQDKKRTQSCTLRLFVYVKKGPNVTVRRISMRIWGDGGTYLTAKWNATKQGKMCFDSWRTSSTSISQTDGCRVSDLSSEDDLSVQEIVDQIQAELANPDGTSTWVDFDVVSPGSDSGLYGC